MLFNSFFGRKNSVSTTSSSSKSAKLNKKNHQPRHFALEPLESRDLLSVISGGIDEATYSEIRAAYPDFDLPENMSEVNVITIEADLDADGLSIGDLKSAITMAGNSELSDLVVVKTTSDNNKMTFSSIEDELFINIKSTQYGSITIIGWGSDNLTIDANQKSRVLRTDGSSTVVNLGGLTITGGDSTANKNNTGCGGGIYNYYGNITISNCTFTGNVADYGGGIYNYDLLTVKNTVIAGNSAKNEGGGIENNWNTCNVINCTIAGNSATYGGGISDNMNVLQISNSIVSSNFASESGTNVISSDLDTSHNNLIGNFLGLFVNAPVFDAEGNLTNTEPIDLHLLSISPAIDKGDNTAAAGIAKDADGYDRIYNNTVDIGAYEYQGGRNDDPIVYSSVVTTLDDSFDLHDGLWSLREAISYAPENAMITFAPSLEGTITLTQGQLVIENAITIDGNGRIAIDANKKSRVFSVEGGTTDEPVVLKGLTIQNGAQVSSGGGIYNSGAITVSNCTVTGNSATDIGGGMFNLGYLTIENSHVLGNSAGYRGGGIFNEALSTDSKESTIVILNSVISENSVFGEYCTGGAIYNEDGILSITNSTIAGNSSTESCGGVCNFGEFTLTNSIITANFDTQGYSLLNSLDAETSHNNILGYYGLFVNEPVFDSKGNLVNTEPIDLHLRSDSRAINAGDNTAAAGIAKDADGYDRIYNNTVDIGAYEYRGGRNDPTIPYSSVVTTLDDVVDPNDGVWSLREAINYAPEYVKISFAPSLEGTITLTQGQLVIEKALAIYGDGRITIDANQKSRAFLVDAGSSENPVALNGLTIINGAVGSYNEGGGIFNSSGVLTVSNCKILDSKAYEGGGISSVDGDLTITNSVIMGNSANYGGGISSSSGFATITNSVLAENTSKNSGGGIYNFSMLTLTNCTITHNYASQTKDGIATSRSMTVNNSIITDYVKNGIYSWFPYNSVTGSNNLTSFTDWDADSDSKDNVSYDPFKPLFVDEEGGDYRLAKGSQAIDLGNNDLATDADGAALEFDLDGLVRINDETVDIGAFEYVNNSSTLSTPILNSPEFDNSTVSVSWPSVLYASGYQFEYKSSTDSDWTVINVATSSASFERDLDLSYKLRLKALVGSGSDYNDSAYSSTINLSPDYSVDYSRIRAKYSEFDLPESEDDINIIVVDLTSGNNLNDLKTAISTAGQTTLPDLIVVCTSDDDNTLSYSSKNDELSININEDNFGSVTIVSWGPEKLTLDANYKSRAMNVQGSSTVVNLGGLTITRGRSQYSAANSSYGGGIYNSYATLTISNSSITMNSASTDGGGIYNVSGDFSIYNSEVAENSAKYGAGIYISSGSGSIVGCEIHENSAEQTGAGVYINYSTISAANNSIWGNAASSSSGGGMNIYDSTVSLTNSVVAGNSALSYGGGIYSSSTYLTVTNCTVAGNSASRDGGGIDSSGYYWETGLLSITNSIVTNNYSKEGTPNLTSNNLNTNNSNNFIGYNGLFVNAPVFDSEGNLKNLDTMDLHLRSDSKAIDKGDNTAAAGIEKDADGYDRIYNGTVDIGAYEFQGDRIDDPLPFSSVVTTLDDVVDPDDGVWSLREVIECAPEYETITFDPSLEGTITLTQGPLAINIALAIDGDGRIAIDANKSSRVFSIAAGDSDNPVVLNGLTIKNGLTDSSGGGIYHTGSLIVSNCAIVGNSAENGGGISSEMYSELTVINCTIAGNTAFYEGGGVGVNYQNSFTITNSIVSSNYAGDTGLNIYFNGEIINQNSIIGGYYGLFVNAPEFDSEGNLTNAETMDIHLRSDSMAIDAGDNSAVSSPTDAEGNARIYNGKVDLGAYEYKGDRDDDTIPYSPVVTTLDDVIDPNDGVWSLREAIYYAPEYVTITFDPSLEGTITLTQGQLVIGNALAIDGDGRITIDANDKSRIFCVEGGTTDNPTSLSGLIIQHGGNYDSDFGGGIFNSGSLKVSNCTIAENFSFNGGGIGNVGELIVKNCEILGNSADFGGGISTGSEALVTIENSVISGNMAEMSCGGIESRGQMSIVNSLITNNEAGYYVGGIASNDSLTITNCTIAGNTTPEGREGISGYESLTVNNSIVIDDIENADSGSLVISGSNNISTFTELISGSNNIEYDSSEPLFVDAANGDYRLVENSLAVDAGNNALAVDADGAALEFDLDGEARISNYKVDIGAYEYKWAMIDLDYEAIRSKYSELDLPESVNDVNIIVVDLTNGGNLADLKAAIEKAGQTTLSDLIVVCTSDDANTLKYGSSDDELSINFDSTEYGSVTIVSWGTQNLKLDANMKSRVISVNGEKSIVNLGGLTATMGRANSNGGGIYSRGLLTVAQSSITLNGANNGSGIYVDSGALNVINSSISGNTAAYAGGGIYVNNGSAFIEDSEISKNYGEFAGGGIYSFQDAYLEVVSCVVYNNISSQGGGIYSGDGNSSIVYSVIQDNFSSAGGGIFNNANMIVVNCLITNNSADDSGGAIYNDVGSLSVTNSTIVGNMAVESDYGGGAGICTFAPIVLNNVIILDSIFVDSEWGGSVSGSNNLSNYAGLNPDSNFAYDSTKPLFVDAENGNYRLADDSQAINLGDNQCAIDVGLDESSTDLAGKRRFVGDSIDIGAYEFANSYSIDYACVVTKKINQYETTDEIPQSIDILTDWDQFYLELWTPGVSEYSSGDTFEVAVNFNPQYHALDSTQTIVTPNGVSAEITDQTLEDDGTITAVVTLTVSKSGYTAPGSNTYWGSILISPNTAEDAGVGVALEQKSLGVYVGGNAAETSIIAMPYDFNFTNAVDVQDFLIFASVFGAKPSDISPDNPNYAYASQADYNNSGSVDVRDFMTFASYFGLKKGKDVDITLPDNVKPVSSGASLPVTVDTSFEEPEDIQLSVETPLAQPEVLETVVTVLDPTPEYSVPAQSAPIVSVQTLRQAHSSALLDLYDNQNEPAAVSELSASAIDEVLYQRDEFDFLFDDSDSDSDDNSDVDLSVVLDELELELI